MTGYLSLCYHYIRPDRAVDPVPDIMCTRIDEFRRQLEMLKRRFRLMPLKEAEEFSYGDFVPEGDRHGMLLTFDDGLSDHLTAARILAEEGIRETFFLPTAILEGFPATPPVMNYILAIHRIGGFLAAYRNALEEEGLSREEYDISYEKGKDNPWEKIKEIKSFFKYKIPYASARRIILSMYRNVLFKENPQALEMMHLTKKGIREILSMGDEIGAHSHTHVSVGAQDLSREDFQKEIIEPKYLLEWEFGVPVYAYSYPFGAEKDCLEAGMLFKRAGDYRLAYNTNKILNTRDTSPYELGRYMPRAEDTSAGLENILERIIKGEKF